MINPKTTPTFDTEGVYTAYTPMGPTKPKDTKGQNVKNGVKEAINEADNLRLGLPSYERMDTDDEKSTSTTANKHPVSEPSPSIVKKKAMTFDSITGLYKKCKIAYDKVEALRVKESELLLNANTTEEQVNEIREQHNKAEQVFVRIKELYHKTLNQQPTASKAEIDQSDKYSTTYENNDHSLLKLLPKFKLLSYDNNGKSGNDKDAFQNVDSFFVNFERVFRMCNANIHSKWKDSLAMCIGNENFDWYTETIEKRIDITYEEAKEQIKHHFESPARATEMFRALTNLRQYPHEPVIDYGKSFVQICKAAQAKDDVMLARMYINGLLPYLQIGINTSLTSLYGSSYFSAVKSFHDVENLVVGLEVNNKGSYEDQINGNGKRSKNTSVKREITNRSKPSYENHKKQKYENCKFCNKPWFKGHRCKEFMEHKKRPKETDKQEQKQNNMKIRSIKASKDLNKSKWAKDVDQLLDDAMDETED